MIAATNNIEGVTKMNKELYNYMFQLMGSRNLNERQVKHLEFLIQLMKE